MDQGDTCAVSCRPSFREIDADRFWVGDDEGARWIVYETPSQVEVRCQQ